MKGDSSLVNWEKALELLCHRVIVTREEVQEKWPLYYDHELRKWITTNDGDWCDGHWIEMLRMTGELTGRTEMIQEAIERTEQIRFKLSDGKISGHRFYYSAARLWSTVKNEDMRTLALAAAYLTRTTALRSNGAIPIGQEMQKSIQLTGGSIVAIDALHPYITLDWWAYKETGDKIFINGAKQMFKLFQEHFLRPDGSTIQFVEFDSKGIPIKKFVRQGYNHDSCWSRGHALAIAGSLLALEVTNEKYFFELSKKLFEYWWDACGYNVPPYDFKAPWDQENPIDTSASAIVLSALSRLLVNNKDPEVRIYYHDKFEHMLNYLLKYLNTDSANGPVGMLTNGCYDYNNNRAINNELIWGDYYLMEALYCLKNGGVPC